MRGRRVAGSLAVGVAAVAWVATSATLARTGEVVTPTDLEAWYNVSPQTLLRGLPPVQPYPPGTLHVGVAAGNEESRTYLTLDLSAVPDGTPLDGGVLVLPLAPDGGTRNPEAARLEACLAPDPGPSVHGSLDPPPAVDCATSSAALRDADGAGFTVDLGPFGDRLRDGGLALVAAAEGRAPGETWHLAFHPRDSDDQDAIPITARFSAAPSAEVPGEGSPNASVAAPPSAGADAGPGETIVGLLPGLGPVGPGLVPSTAIAATQVDAPPAEPRPAPGVAPRPITPAATVTSGGFRYGAVFGLPLALLAFVAYFGAALTRDVPPAVRRDPVSPPRQEG